jgi:splicing factor 3B subunit 3
MQGYSDMGRYTLAPLSYEALDYASGFASDQCPEGFCAVSKSMLRILTLERLGEAFNQQASANLASCISKFPAG